MITQVKVRLVLQQIGQNVCEKGTLFHYAQNSEQFDLNPSFNELGIFNNFSACMYEYLITLMLVNMSVFNVNMLVNSCNLSCICK